MTAETKPSPAPDPEEPPKISRIPRWVSATAALALTVGIVAVILFYGYQSRPGWVGVADKKFWDYLELLFVPAALAIGVYWLNRAQRERELKAQDAQQNRERKAEEDRRQRELKAQAAQRKRELEIEKQRAQDVALQAYLDQMSQLLLDKDKLLRQSQAHDEARIVARARTLTVLKMLDSERKSSLLQFLCEAALVQGSNERALPIISLHKADLSGANLVRANLNGADLREANLQATNLG
jgi:hypothetical protein